MSDPNKKVRLYDSDTDEMIGEFDTVEQAIEHADLHDLTCYIKHEDIAPMS